MRVKDKMGVRRTLLIWILVDIYFIKDFLKSQFRIPNLKRSNEFRILGIKMKVTSPDVCAPNGINSRGSILLASVQESVPFLFSSVLRSCPPYSLSPMWVCSVIPQSMLECSLNTRCYR